MAQYELSDVNELSDEQLERLVKESEENNVMLSMESEMFERYLIRVDPHAKFHGSDAHFTPGGSQSSDPYAVRAKRKKSHRYTQDRMQALSTEQKCDIASKEIERLTEEIRKYQQDAENLVDTYEAVIEEADISLMELRKETSEFERDIIKGAVNRLTNKIRAEKYIRYLEEKLKNNDVIRDKMKLKNVTLRIKDKKLTLQMKQKEEIGNVLDMVDFNQLKILNEQYTQTLTERNKDLLRLKLMAGNSMQILNSFKRKLQTLTKESDRLTSEITSRTDLRKKLDHETQNISVERSQALKTNKKLRARLRKYQVPKIMEYVLGNTDLQNIQQETATLERKLHIAKISYKNHSKTWKKLKQTVEYMPDAQLQQQKCASQANPNTGCL